MQGGRYALTPLGLDLIAISAGLVQQRAAPNMTTRWAAVASVATSPASSAAITPHGREDAHVVRYERQVTALAYAPAHTAGVYSFFAQLAVSANVNNEHGAQHRLLWWETGRACARHYHELDGWHAIYPDGAGEYQVGARRLRFWLEWDRGTMNRRDLEVKFAAYAHYVRSREWQMDGNDPLPVLLVVTSDIAQDARLRAALAVTMADARNLAVWLTSSEALHIYGSLAAIWRSYEQRPERTYWSSAHTLL